MPRECRLRFVRAGRPGVPVQVAGLHQLGRRVNREGVPRGGLADRRRGCDRLLPAGGALRVAGGGLAPSSTSGRATASYVSPVCPEMRCGALTCVPFPVQCDGYEERRGKAWARYHGRDRRNGLGGRVLGDFWRPRCRSFRFISRFFASQYDVHIIEASFG